MKIGKLTNEELKQFVLNKIQPKNKETIIGAGVGEDCCALKIEDGVSIISTDPITAATKKAGMLAIHINANDIAAAGGEPIAALVTLLIPKDTQMEQVCEVLDQLISTAKELNIDITGGHTEVTDAVNRIVLSVTVIGKKIGDKVFCTANMQEGDYIIMTKYAGLEGSAIIGDDCPPFAFSKEESEELKYIKSAVSVVKEGRIGALTQGTHAMHDVTEGGIIGAICEMCEASALGARVELNKIPVLSITKKLCNHYKLDVYRLISSGSMLITTSNPTLLADALEKENINTTIIGRVTKTGVVDENNTSLFSDGKDELYKCLKN